MLKCLIYQGTAGTNHNSRGQLPNARFCSDTARAHCLRCDLRGTATLIVFIYMCVFKSNMGSSLQIT